MPEQRTTECAMKRLPVIAVSLEMLSLVSASLTAQSWQPAGFGAGGFFPQIMVDPADSSIVYLAADVSGLNKSTNYGDSWFKINSGLECREVAAFAIDPANSLRLWASVTGAHGYFPLQPR